MRALGPIAVLIIIIVVVVGASLIAYYLNETRQMYVSGWEIAFKAACTYSGTTDAGTTDVTLDTGQTTRVGWDGKAVGVIATVQKYWGVDNGPRYYGSINFAHGSKGSDPGWILPGECYKATWMGWVWYYPAGIDSRKFKMEVEKDNVYSISSALEARGFKVSIGSSTSSPTKYIIEVEIGLYDAHAYGRFEFSHGSKGWFCSCNYDESFQKVVELESTITGP
ncbi:hypothetical protein Smar_1561 [Staphylothermus marinus F1]|uniref:Uncharacterized protein n=1 Tax=Staphylothermus marinus (strain ATCC 43588 / DSM 3639 / JCM 9404 / F1) TaxID=399550 RepID=A3DPT6_STAMF|nr:hypothetical protein [Staphylothermus marinus]ABN70646.1 hypothetical protein Smar_1561 [Staphylothermus marinus F1]